MSFEISTIDDAAGLPPVRETTDAESGRDRLLVADADRDRVGELLGRALAEGRLTDDEHERRTGLALTARTVADLQAAVDQIPGGAVAVRGDEQASLPTRSGSYPIEAFLLFMLSAAAALVVIFLS